MLYYLFKYFREQFELSGAGVFQFISFRALMAIIFSLIISLLLGKALVRFLQKQQIGEIIRDLGLEGQMKKQGTPTMGGLIILGAILIPTLLFARIDNVYIIIMLLTTVWLGIIGFMDDYIKVFKKDKRGLSGGFKVIGQVGLGLIVGLTLYFNDDVTVLREKVKQDASTQNEYKRATTLASSDSLLRDRFVEAKAPITTIPFVKNHEFNYSKLVTWIDDALEQYTWIIYTLIVIFIITAVSNGANITDGIDGLATGTSAIIGVTLGVFAYVSGNIVAANYLNIMYIPNTGELVIFIAAFVGACIGFLWYNSYPAQVFMGDTGSLALGGIIASLAIILRKELLIPILCGIFLVENLSVMIQVSYFKYTKKKYGEGRRIFKMSPLHHHYQKLDYPEPKIVTRFWIIGIILAVLTIVTLKLR
ncbi:MAG: phospho-N-acetylmuramoyl-pentapeptide-transferase [Bacteroidetes bacterium]|nr:phospho-N-acetylmuramoyl-pentapeptide-transferase [Bacteroidota bacterium]